MKLSTQIFIAFALILSLSILDSTFNYLLSLKVKQNSEFRNRSQDIIRNSARLHKAMIEMETSFRGFLLTGDSGFINQYEQGISVVPAILTEQRELVAGNPAQTLLLDSIMARHKAWLVYADSFIVALKQYERRQIASPSKLYVFENRFKKKYGENLFDDIAKRFLSFDKIEYDLRALHTKNLNASINSTHRFSLAFFALTILIGVASIVYIIRLISKRIKGMVTLAESIAQGKFATIKDNRNDELTSLSVSLNTMSERLYKNITELERQNAELDKFAYVVSHDLKAPLRGIHNAIKWIEEDLGKEVSPAMQKYLDIIPERIKRMENLINGLLDYAKVRKKTAFEYVNVNELVSEIVAGIVPPGFKVRLNHLPTIIAERLKLEQVFTNLISNAVKYTQTDNGEIVVDCSEQQDWYEFSVKDNGIGIEPEYHEKVFEIFQTLREKGERESTGIGLAIVKKILDDQHCMIRIHSAAGQGTTFVFTWPKRSNI